MFQPSSIQQKSEPVDAKKRAIIIDHVDNSIKRMENMDQDPATISATSMKLPSEVLGSSVGNAEETVEENCEDKDDDHHEFKYKDENIDIKTYNISENYDINPVVEALTTGDGYAIIKNAISQKDVEILRERVMYFTCNEKKETLKSLENLTPVELQNHFHGLIWGLINKGRIFEKLLLHPLIQNISRVLLGEDAQLLSYTANTVAPGQPGQTPHLDYPYYRSFFPKDEKYRHPMMTQPLALVFITLITDFTVENGSTALRPNSHKVPTYPKDQDEFFAKAIQVVGKAGDIVVMRSSVQHCAMPNRSDGVRSGILLHMGPCFIRPYENIPDSMEQSAKDRASEELRKVLSLDNPYPRLKD